MDFAQQVQPIFQARCLFCHNPTRQKGGLDVTTLATLFKGGDNGPAVVPGNLEKGTLWESLDTDRMPRGSKKLTEAEKQVIRDWILTARKDP